MQLFSRETLEGLLERAGFSVLKTVDMQDKNKNITQLVKVEFLKLRNQVNERVNLNSNLPCKKKKIYIYIYINVCLCYLMCERTISDVSLKHF